MIALLQRVSQASVTVSSKCIAEIDAGLLVFLGVEKNDQTRQADRLLERVLNYRVFPDSQDKMNLSLRDMGGGLLIVPQFTLAADTRKGNRPSFSSAASPDHGQNMVEYFVKSARELHNDVATGQFGADMKVALINDGPVTFWLSVE